MHWGDHLRELEKLRDSTHISQQPRQGYARGGSVKNKMKKLASEGRGGDTKLAKIGPRTAKALDDAVHKGRVQRNPKTGLREYMLGGRETRAGKRKLAQTPYNPLTPLPANYYDNIPQQNSGSCVLHSTDNVLREIGERSGVQRPRRGSDDIRAGINRAPIPKARGRRRVDAVAAVLDGNEVNHTLDRIGVPYNRIANHADALPEIIQNILPNQPPAGNSHSVIFEGIPYLHPENDKYIEQKRQNMERGNTDNSHAMNITRMNLYDKKKQRATKRRGSLDFLDSNNPGLQRGLIYPGPEYPVYSKKHPKRKGIPNFNLQNDPTNVIYDIDAAKASQDLQDRGVYPFGV